MYNVDLEELARVNHIADTTAIELGQLILVPNGGLPQAQVPKDTSDDFIWPVKGKVITLFGQTCNNIINKGINIKPYENNDVVAAKNGRVVFSSDSFGSYGKTIIIDHGDGLSTVYSRNQEILIRVGDSVERGMVIAKAGNAGRDKNVYLHFEIRKGHIPQNPYYYLP